MIRPSWLVHIAVLGLLAAAAVLIIFGWI